MVLAITLVLLASWTIGGIIQTIPDLGLIDEEPVDDVNGDGNRWVIEGGDLFSLLLNTFLALVIGILAGSIMSLVVVKKSELISKLYAVAIIALGLAVLLYIDVDMGLPSLLQGRGNIHEWLDLGALSVRGVTIGLITFLGIVLLILIIISINALTSTSPKGIIDESLILEGDEEKKEVVESITETMGKAVEELSRGDDIREVIIRVYKEMCSLFERGGVRNKDSMTPRELEYLALRTFDIDTKVIGDLTETFEEARYSTHNLDEEDRERVLREFKELKWELECIF
ncbi:MAG: DUF4129 domain-containing protein [Thermoplasmatota archaeon]